MPSGEGMRSDGHGRFALIVSFELVDGMAEAFRRMVEANATDTVRLEPGCLRFDVLEPEDGAGPHVVLYEIYTDRAAFDRHLATPHYLEFDRRTRVMVRHKAVRFFAVRENVADPVARVD